MASALSSGYFQSFPLNPLPRTVPLFFPVFGRMECEIRDSSMNHNSCKALIQEPFSLTRYVLHVDTGSDLQTI